MTLADAIVVRRTERAPEWVRTLALVVLGSMVVALSAQIAFRLPWTPVPITGQTLGVLLVGAALGARRGFAALVLYMGEGLAGLPVFAGGTAGAAVLLGPTAGYLVSFPLAAAAVGWLAERGWDRRPVTTVAAMTLGTAIIFAVGLAWLSRFVPGAALWTAGFAPFVPGAAVKIVAAAAALPIAWRFLGRSSKDPDPS